MNKKEEYSAYWETEKFEDLVTRGLIAMYESKIKIYKRNLPATRISEELIYRIRKLGCYFPSNDRVIVEDINDESGKTSKIQTIDIINDGRPNQCIWTNDANNLWEKGYLQLFYMEAIKVLPKPFKIDNPGKLYRVAALNFGEKITGICDYVTIDKKGIISSVYRPINFYDPITCRYMPVKHNLMATTKTCENVVTAWASATLQFYQDRLYLWNVQAKEGIAKATFSVHEEQIKSLFYSRELPMTLTGRKRPILHWVKSHQRRMKEGIDYDVKEHLRGTSEFIYNGTRFEIINPKKE